LRTEETGSQLRPGFSTSQDPSEEPFNLPSFATLPNLTDSFYLVLLRKNKREFFSKRARFHEESLSFKSVTQRKG